MSSSENTIVIIGGGVSGIVQAKWLLHHKVSDKIVLFEKFSSFGGVWDVSREHGVMDCTVCNVSKYVMELTHFPWPAGTINFPHHVDVLKYIQSYAAKFIPNNSVECHFNCDVVSVNKVSETKILIKYRNMLYQDNIKSITADHVIIANGHSTVPNYPLPGADNFDFVSHSAGYKNCSKLGLFEKHVLVVGVSFSAVDISVDLIKEGNNNVTVLTRRGTWFAPKQDPNGVPSDIKLPRFFMYLPHNLQNFLIKRNLNRTYFNQDNWKISNKCDPAGGSLVSSEAFVKLVRDDEISVIHGHIDNIDTDKSVTIKTSNNEIELHKFDHVIFCTGYKPSFEFLSDDLKSVGISAKNWVYPNLFLNMIPIDNTNLISYIGLVNSKYTSPLQIVDLQAQYIACMLTRKILLPEKEIMKEIVQSQLNHLQVDCKAFRGSLFFQTDYQDVLATAIGKVPKLWLLKTPKLWIQYYLGPITWAGYHLGDSELNDLARKSLDQTCEQAFGISWFLKLQLIAVVSVALLSAAFLSAIVF